MKFSVLASGSKGNCTYIECGNKKILIDLGISDTQLKGHLDLINVDSEEIDFILITHEHTDHISGLKKFCKKNNPIVLLNETCFFKLDYINNKKIIESSYEIDDLKITRINLSHDAECIGFLVEYNSKSLVYITDTGYLHIKNMKQLKNKNSYIFESNHDVNLLMNNDRYPYYLKQRILGSNGHLSNVDASLYLSKLVGDNTKVIVLAHLSENNNNEDIALETIFKKFKQVDIKIDNIFAARQNEQTKVVEI